MGFFDALNEIYFKILSFLKLFLGNMLRIEIHFRILEENRKGSMLMLGSGEMYYIDTNERKFIFAVRDRLSALHQLYNFTCKGP